MDDGISLIIGSSTAGAMITLIGQYIAARMKKTATVGPQPFMVKEAERYVTCEECIRKHMTLDKRHDDLAEEIKRDRQGLSDQLSGIRNALTHNDEKAEERSRNLHKRIDVYVLAVAGAKANIDNHLQDHRAHNNGGNTI